MIRRGLQPLRTALRPLLVALLLLAGPLYATPRQGWLRIDLPATGSFAMRYLPYSADPHAALPVIVFLHGSGSSPQSWMPLVQPIAEDLGVVVVLPQATSPLGWGIGPDDETILAALDAVRHDLTVDAARVAIAGHSSGGAFAYVVAYFEPLGFSGVAAFSAPYRTVLWVADAPYQAPLYLFYGDQDPNYQSGTATAIEQMVERLGVPVTLRVEPGAGHSDWSLDELETAFSFLLEQRYPAPLQLAPRTAPPDPGARAPRPPRHARRHARPHAAPAPD